MKCENSFTLVLVLFILLVIIDVYKRQIMHIIAPIILATCVYNLVTTIDMYIFYFAQSFHHIEDVYKRQVPNDV